MFIWSDLQFNTLDVSYFCIEIFLKFVLSKSILEISILL
jgi:hypothetical protein